MKALAASLVLALAAGCGGGGGTPRPSASPSPTVSTEVADIAYVDGTGVHLRGHTGAVRDLDSSSPHGVAALVWSVDGRYVAWLRGTTLHVHDVASGKTGAWTAPDRFVASTAGATAAGFVLVSENGYPWMALLDPAAVLAGTAAPPVGISTVSRESTVRLLVATAARILVADAEGTAASGGPEAVYDVTPGGQATFLFTDGEDQPEGEVRNLPMYPAVLTGGRTLLYETGATAGPPCDTVQFLVTWDLVGKQEVAKAPQPRLSVPLHQRISALTVGADGQAYAVLTVACPGTTPSALFRRDPTGWTRVADDVTWGAGSVDGRLAVVESNGDLAVAGAVVAHHVTAAAWAPRAG